MKYTKEDIILDFINTFAGFNAKVINRKGESKCLILK